MARLPGLWTVQGGSYIQPVGDAGYDILLYGSNKYLNFGVVSGSTGYGLRDNDGVMQFKDSSGSWSSFSDIGGTPAGSNTQIQFNDSGAFGASNSFTYNDSTKQLKQGYDAYNYWTDTISSDGGRTIAGFGTDADINFDLTGATDGDFSVNTDQLVVDTSTGRVGLGTSSPSYDLHISKDNAEVYIGTSQKGYLGIGTQADYSNNFVDETAVVINTVALKGDGSSRLLVRGHGDGDNAALLVNQISANIYTTSGNAPAIFTAKDSEEGGTRYANVYFGGEAVLNEDYKVQISPDFVNHVGLILKAIPSQTANIFEIQSSTGTVLSSCSPSGDQLTQSLKIDGADNFGSGFTLSAESGYKRIQSYGGQIIAINSLGNNVSIGKTTASDKLDVNGTVRATGFNASGSAGVSGSFTTTDGKTVTVTSGLITSIV